MVKHSLQGQPVGHFEKAGVTMQALSQHQPAEPLIRGILRHQVTFRILTGVFQERFRSGERLVVQRLSQLYDVSPTPVREALVELAALGIVKLLPNRGAVLLPFGPEQVREIGQVRRVLEVEAARCACGRIDPSALAALRNDVAALLRRPADTSRDRDARECDTELHGVIAESCGSARLTAEINRYLTLFGALRDVSHQRDAATNYSRSDDVREHLEILDGLQHHDPEGAALAMDRHIRSATQAIEEVMFSNQEAEPSPCGNGQADSTANAPAKGC
jgi:DNA-binding GntR family transcriptional regulator